MADNILALAFEISADPSKAEAALARFRASSVAGVTDISRLWSGAMNGVTGPAGIALGAVVGLGGGMLELASKAAEVGAKIYEAHEKTGLASKSLSALMAVSIETKGNFESLTTSLARAGVNLEKTTEAGGKANKLLFDLMGGAKGAAELGLKPMDERIQTVLKHIFALNDVGQRNTALTELLGRGWMNNVNQLRLLAEQGYAPAIEQAKRFGVFFDDNSARQAKQFQVGMATLRAEISALALQAGQKLIPFWTGWDQGMAGMIPHLESWGQKILAIELAITGVGIPAAIDLWRESNKKFNESVQAETDFLVRLDAVTRGAAKAGEEGRKSTVAHTKALKEEKTETAEIVRLFGQLSLEVNTTDSDYRQYLKTLGEINRLEDQHSREVLAGLNDERLRQSLTTQANTLAKEQTRLSADLISKGLKPETVEIKNQKVAWDQLLATQLKIHPKTVEFIRDMNQQGNSIKQLRQEVIKTFVLGLPGDLNVSRQALALWANDVKLHISTAEVALTALRLTAVQAFTQLNQAMGMSIANAFVYSKSIGAAMEAALKSTLATISGEALVRMLYEIAQGYACAASPWTAWMAPGHFAAAKMFGVVAAVAGVAGRAIPGGEVGAGGGGGSVAGPSPGGAAGGTAAPSRALTPGAAGVRAATLTAQAARPVEIHIHFEAPVYGGPAGVDELSKKIAVPVAKYLTRAVQTLDVKLVSSHTVNPVPVSTGKS